MKKLITLTTLILATFIWSQTQHVTVVETELNGNVFTITQTECDMQNLENLKYLELLSLELLRLVNSNLCEKVECLNISTNHQACLTNTIESVDNQPDEYPEHGWWSVGTFTLEETEYGPWYLTDMSVTYSPCGKFATYHIK